MSNNGYYTQNQWAYGTATSTAMNVTYRQRAVASDWLGEYPEPEKPKPSKLKNEPEQWLRGRVKEICDLSNIQ